VFQMTGGSKFVVDCSIKLSYPAPSTPLGQVRAILVPEIAIASCGKGKVRKNIVPL